MLVIQIYQRNEISSRNRLTNDELLLRYKNIYVYPRLLLLHGTSLFKSI